MISLTGTPASRSARDAAQTEVMAGDPVEDKQSALILTGKGNCSEGGSTPASAFSMKAL